MQVKFGDGCGTSTQHRRWYDPVADGLAARLALHGTGVVVE